MTSADAREPSQVEIQPPRDAAAPGTAPARTPGKAQALTLLLASCLVVLGAVLLTPVQPMMQKAFAGTPGVAVLIPIVVTIPALMIGLLAPIAGAIVDRLGRKRVLVTALVLYAFVGTAPLWLNSLPLIVASRACVGLAEAAILTTCTTLIADYFTGKQRDRYLGLQTVFTTIAATIFFGIGGALGGLGWRVPFWAYASALVFAVMVAFLIWQPEQPPRTEADAEATRTTRTPFPWRTVAAPCAVTLFGGVIFYVPIVELSFKLDQIGVQATAVIGAVSAIASVATAIGAASFARLASRGHHGLLPVAFGTAGIGIVVLGFGPVVPLVALGAVIASAGCGLMLPTLLTWAINPLVFEQRGRGTGLWTASLNVGQFICPLVVLGLAGVLGGLPVALALVGVLSLTAAAGVRVAALRRRVNQQPAYGPA